MTSEKKEGITMQDIVEHRDMNSFFRSIDFTKSKNYVEMLQNDFDLRDALKPIHRENQDIGIKIIDEGLKDFLTLLECTMSYIFLRLRDTIAVAVFSTLYKKERRGVADKINNNCRRKHLQPSYSYQVNEAIKWYIDICGRNDFNRFYHDCEEYFSYKICDIEKQSVNKQIKQGIRAKRREIRKFIEDRASQIERWDKNIIASYHGYIICDKKVNFTRGPEQYNKYCDYVRNSIPDKYSTLINELTKMIYPEFLRRYHNTNQKLVEFTKNLPNNP